MATTLFLINNNALIVPRGDPEDATEIIGSDHISADGTATPDLIAVKWGLQLEVFDVVAIKDAIWALYIARTVFPVRDEAGTVRQCLIPHGQCTFRRVHRGAAVPYYTVTFTVREQ